MDNRINEIIKGVDPNEDVHPVSLADAVQQYEEGLKTINGDTCPVTIPGNMLRVLLRDRKLLNFLEQENNKGRYTGRCLFRLSSTGRGWRLHETEAPEASFTVREAIIDAMDRK